MEFDERGQRVGDVLEDITQIGGIETGVLERRGLECSGICLPDFRIRAMPYRIDAARRAA